MLLGTKVRVETKTNGQTNARTDRQTDRQTDGCMQLIILPSWLMQLVTSSSHITLTGVIISWHEDHKAAVVDTMIVPSSERET